MKKKFIIGWMIIIAVISLQWFQIQFSSLLLEHWLFVQNIFLLVINIGLMFVPNLMLNIISGNWIVTLGITSTITTILSVINYYVMAFHGSPIAVSELANLKTAINVASGYDLFIDRGILYFSFAFIVEIIGVFCLHKLDSSNEIFRTKSRILSIGVLMLDFCIIYIELFSSYAIKPEKAIGWSWKDAMSNYGYLTCLVEDFGNTINPYMEPEGYNEKVITIKNNSKKSETEVYPDIVLILNESFFDLSVYCDMKTDHNYMEKFYSIDNAVYGYAVTPSIGGGTNNSEYELLTTHSMSLLRSPAPFNYVDLAASDNNIVRYVEGLGYKTYGMHCQNGSNIHVILHILQ